MRNCASYAYVFVLNKVVVHSSVCYSLLRIMADSAIVCCCAPSRSPSAMATPERNSAASPPKSGSRIVPESPMGKNAGNRAALIGGGETAVREAHLMR